MVKRTTHFGFERIPVEDKVKRVADVFESVADKYDLMNDLMSFGAHRLWKRYAISLSGVRSAQRVLDLAGGTGDLAAQLSQRVGVDGEVVLCDINRRMLRYGRDRLTDQGLVGNLYYVQADAETLPFTKDYFDCVMIGFGLRNVTHKDRALDSIYRVLKPGGRLIILEFSKPNRLIEPFYDLYSFKLLPLLGSLVARDAGSYQYLAESIRMHPDQEELKEMMVIAGFERCDYFNLQAGIVSVHRGYKICA